MKYQEMLSFASFLNKTEGNDSPEWKKAMQSVNQLLEAMGPYQLPQGDKTYRKIDPAAYARIDAMFDEAVTSVRAFIKGQADAVEDEVRLQLMKNFNKEFLAKSYIEYKNVKPSNDIPLAEAMENFRYENVTLTSADLKRVGGNLSSRVELNVDFDGKKTRGVFTRRTAYEPKAQFGRLLDEMDAKYGKFASFWEAMDDQRFFDGGFSAAQALLFCNSATGVVYDLDDPTRNAALTNFRVATGLHLYPELDREFERYRNDPDFFVALFDFSLKAEQLSTSIGVNEEFLGLKNGENIDSRNSAMSSVANLLGVGNLLARSKQLAVYMPDGTSETGTFMEYVDAKDINHLDAIDEMRIYGLDAYEGSEVKVQLSNLQVLDYICGNVDRHLGNMLYQFDPNTHKLSGIKGIDNDASFLKRPLGISESLSQLCSLRQMRVIDEAMAKKLLTIDEGMLTATLHGYGLSEEEISAAYDRFHNLQEAVRNAETYDPEKGLPPYDGNGEGYGITIVKTEDWEKLSLNELKAGNNNFAKIINVQKAATSMDMVTQPMIQSAELSKRALKTMLTRENTQDLLSRARSHKPIMGVSERYQNVLDALEAYQNCPAPEDPLHSDGDPKWDRLAELKRAVDTYQREKIEAGHLLSNGDPAREFSGKALGRIEDVQKIGRFANHLLEQRKLALNADENLHEAERKQRELDEFKALPPQEQQIILDQHHAHQQLLKQDLSVRLQNSLEEEAEPSFEESEVDINQNLSMDDIAVESD